MNYVKKIKVFTHTDSALLEQKVNNFLREEIARSFTVLNIQFAATAGLYSCMVYYTVQEEDINV